MFETRNSVSARIRHRVDLFGKQMVGDGEYLEQRRSGGPAVRLELRIQMGDQTSTLLQVCDGQYYWVHRKLLDRETLSRTDAVRASSALAEAQEAAPAQAACTLPGLGGLPRLLRGLNAAFQFTSAEPGQWGNLQVWKLEGGWKPAYLLRMLPKQREAILQGKPVDLSGLQEHVPDRVVLLLGQEDLFPYRIEYCRTSKRKEGKSEVAETRCLLSVDYFEVHFNSRIDPGQFSYNPGNAEFSDQTEAFLQSLGVKKR